MIRYTIAFVLLLAGCDWCERVPSAELCCAAVCGDGMCAAIDANGAPDCSPGN